MVYAGDKSLLRSSSTPQAAVENLADEIRARDWGKAYTSLANKAQFTQQAVCARSDRVLPQPAHLRDAGQALTYRRCMLLTAKRRSGSSCIGPRLWAPCQDTRDLHVVRNGDRWQVDWPIVKEQPCRHR